MINMKWVSCTLIGGLIGISIGGMYHNATQLGGHSSLSNLSRGDGFYKIVAGGILGAITVNGISLALDCYNIYTEKAEVCSVKVNPKKGEDKEQLCYIQSIDTIDMVAKAAQMFTPIACCLFNVFGGENMDMSKNISIGGLMGICISNGIELVGACLEIKPSITLDLSGVGMTYNQSFESDDGIQITNLNPVDTIEITYF